MALNVTFEQLRRLMGADRQLFRYLLSYVLPPPAPAPPSDWPARWEGEQLNLSFGEKFQLIRYKRRRLRRATAGRMLELCDARMLVHGEPDFTEVCVSCARPLYEFHYITHCGDCSQ